ncbi:helix-turn-helix domain-containing protein [Pseudovibrio sp. Tun.PSC04-5.I4]|uniref:helix-turn-helix domain-containing protein n=1 Tax=Pseudovibrio sp. Tun.PSC04-5.I4 TaxID=1798213 RepID=UPI00088D4655|nr:helix-turn-helix domain-containing protein [Pseudovibrio sp. Tun.PSC04-5.I4]SDR08229.1 Helix-turn-helix [Pseudovibrio sp. Tun.PSC04-5.I4]
MARKATSKTKLGQRLIEIRGDENRGEYCARLGINDRTYRDYESGKSLPNSDTLKLISNVHDVSLNWLILGEGPMRLNEQDAPKAAAIEKEFFARVLETTRKAYAESSVRISDVDLGRLAAEKYEEYIVLAHEPDDEEERLALMALLKRRLIKDLMQAHTDQATSKRRA